MTIFKSKDPATEAVNWEGEAAGPAQVQAAVDTATGLGALRVVVNCAGVATPGKLGTLFQDAGILVGDPRF